MTPYEKRVAELEAEGLTTSDAQGVADVELMKKERAMKKPKHTPGPWKIQPTPDDNNLIMAYSPNKERMTVIARVDKGPDISNKHCATTTKEGSANTHLISAAPDMLEALEVAALYFNDNGGHESYSWLGQIESAIKKARGES